MTAGLRSGAACGFAPSEVQEYPPAMGGGRMRAAVSFRPVSETFVVALVTTLILGPSLHARAAPGALDRSFGSDGRVSTDFTRAHDAAFGVAIQQDGRIVAVGSTRTFGNFGLTRYNRDGTLDPSFGGDGRVSTNFTLADDDVAEDVAVQADGNLVVVGSSGFFGNPVWTLARYLPDGSLDPAFGDGGEVTTDFNLSPDVTEWATAVAIDADGKIVAVGSVHEGRFALARYNTDGTPDSSFDGDGMLTTKLAAGDEAAEDVAIQADGSIVVVGHIGFNRFALARYMTNGALDPSFGGDGTVTTSFRGDGRGTGLVIQDNGKIVAAGIARGKFALARYNVDGTFDPTFGKNGRVTTGFTPAGAGAWDVGLDPDGRIVAAGDASGSFAVARYRRTGRLDASFGDHGRVMTKFGQAGADAWALAIQGNGRIVVAGEAHVRRGRDSKFALARYRA